MKQVLIAIAALCAGLAAPLDAQTVRPAEVGAPVYPSLDGGEMRTFAQYEWDKKQGRIVRVVRAVFDPLAADAFDLRWLPQETGADPAGYLSGKGTLIWRRKGFSPRDPDAVIASFSGDFENGVATGKGDFHHISGLRYQGQWQDGVMHGTGLLLLPNGDQYAGGFKRGRQDGTGSLTDVFGNILDGQFADGQPHGPGTRYPKAHRAYQARWSRGRELVETRVLMRGRAGVAHVVDVAGQIYPDVEVGINVAPPPPGEDGEAAFLPYNVARSPSVTLIKPDDPRLLGAWRGELDIRRERYAHTTESFAGDRSRYGPVPLIINIANRGARPLRIVGAYVDMQGSQSDRRPALTVSSSVDAICGDSAVRTDFTLKNYGWAAAQATRVNMIFVDPYGAAVSQSFTADLGQLQQAARVDFRPIIEGLGVNLAYLRQNPFVCASNEDCLSKAKNTGLFGALTPALARDGLSFEVRGEGYVSFTWQTARGETRQGQAPFSADFVLGSIQTMAECGAGAPVVPIMSNILTLPADSGPQPIPLSVGMDVGAGTVARLSLNVAATMTSNHRFQVVLQLSDGREAASQPVEMLYFTPNHWDGP
ncbi:hypothetical protein KX928_05600 [Roseobacter sp. YSTF-M11]|uniref:MORN repeat protein n=1 Tax=Roseobacter insulae TaxID=2859783 RepID=A0A9X1FT39_9RHOB|nr:hypothetical protein [Roseobacter insulae]MBW4707256.1 hypothetical protein [Roseobacter insulae]